METIREFKRAFIDESSSGVLIAANRGLIHDKHYNVTITKEGGFYIITGEKANYEIYIDKQTDPVIVASVVDEQQVKPAPSWLNFFNPTKYVKGWCELVFRTPRKYTTTNITIIENN